jgi:hypothetical protein
MKKADILKKQRKRDYRKEYDDYHGTPKQRKNRSSRVLARRKMIKKVGEGAVNGKDVDHKDGNPRNNSDQNLRILAIKKNRASKKKKRA